MKLDFTSTWQFPRLAARLGALLVGNPTEIFPDGERRYQIGVGNNWWLYHLEGTQYRLSYRYGNEELLQTYSTVLQHLGIIEPMKPPFSRDI